MQWYQAFLDRLAETSNVAAACRHAGISRQTAYVNKAANAEFAALWDQAIEDATDDLELEARRRAKDGCEKPVFYQGEECGSVREYSDTLMIFLLKAHRPDKYRENSRLDLSGG